MYLNYRIHRTASRRKQAEGRRRKTKAPPNVRYNAEVLSLCFWQHGEATKVKVRQNLLHSHWKQQAEVVGGWESSVTATTSS